MPNTWEDFLEICIKDEDDPNWREKLPWAVEVPEEAADEDWDEPEGPVDTTRYNCGTCYRMVKITDQPEHMDQHDEQQDIHRWRDEMGAGA